MSIKVRNVTRIIPSSRASMLAWIVFLSWSSVISGLVNIGHLAEARITRIVIQTRTSPAFGGASFGAVGQYEQLTGVAFGEVNPKDPLNAVITDIELAPRNTRGNVEYSMDFAITKPVDMSRGNKTLLYDVPNRGNIRSPELNVGGNATNVGDGFLQREGYTLVDSGWEGDLTTGLRITLPVAKRRDGREIRGRVRAEYILGSAASTQDVTEPPAYEAISTDNAKATLTRRVHQNDPRELIPNSQWAFADCTSVPFPGVADPTKVCLQGGFDTNHIYELLYTAKNPMVMGLGFAATRDFISFLRSNNRDRHRDLENPLGDGIENAIIYGSSQSGRWIRTFIQLGFNQDEHRRQVVEGAIPHKASNRGAFNIRFAQPTRLSGTQHSEAQYPGVESPQTWDVSHDPFSGITAGQLERCRRTHTCPKITHTNTDTEYWQAVMSLNTTDSTGTQDLEIPPEVRIYDLAGTQHGGGNPLMQPPAVLPTFPNACQLRSNSNPFIHAQRTLLVALREWIVNGTEPPPSLYSSLSKGSLVKPTEVHIPYIPAVNFTVPGLVNYKFYLDRGQRFDVEDIAGIMAEPPVFGAAYNVLVPQVDVDGNPIDGLRNTNVQVPLGTYTGWNIRKAGFSEGDSCDLTGSFIPFFKTEAERRAAGDPRLSLEERYPTHADYVDKVTAAANNLVIQRLLLREDADSIIAAANAAPVP
ncbi:MAG TPA: alpha/beta hydrolase domain-containing protein [Candidatus Polarisedimenticolaceae bacterium]|nr:alpha/beta hydrolase domain-containing protein [Candidatus Polarisedimenticolaceae bacterium]